MADLTIDLEGTKILDISGTRRHPLKGTFTATMLADALVAAWVPYFECHQCGRFDYCKFVKRHPANQNRAVDIQCGVATTAIRGLIGRCFDFLRAAGPKDRQDFLDGSFHFFKFVYGAELQIGNFLDDDILNWWSTYAPSAFGQLTGLRSHLDAVAHHLGRFPGMRATDAVLLVEGWSEKSFVERLKQSGLASLTRLNVRTYGGSGNRRPGRIEMLLQQYGSDGYSVFIQGDADGHPPEHLFAELARKMLVAPGRSFVFRQDFETSIPGWLLYEALDRIEEVEHLSRDAFEAAVRSHSGSVARTLKSAFDLDLEPLKVPLSNSVADLLNEVPWWDEDGFMQTELGAFLKFLQTVR